MKVIIWGHKLHSHTHSYIHEAFFRAFSSMGYQTCWLDDDDDVRGIDFAESLFLTEGQVDKKIPIRSDCRYVLHYCDPTKYSTVSGRCIFLERTFLGDRLNTLRIKPDVEGLEQWTYLEKDYHGSFGWKYIENVDKIPAIYMLWGTNLLPREFNTECLDIRRSEKVYWVGTVGTGIYGNATELGPFSLACDINNNHFYKETVASTEQHISIVQKSYLAPTIVGKWQLDNGYIPCRVFKNTSYGQPPFTNSKYINEIFGNDILCNTNTFEIFYQAREMAEKMKKPKMMEMMEFVKCNHTYINRVQTILRFFQ